MLTASRIVLGAALAAIPAVAQTTVEVSDFLPLSVGNSWTYVFIYDDPRRHPDQFHGEEITISILRTEMIDGNAYYEFSDIPEGFAVAPAHSIAGKKLRWKGSHLMEHDGVSEYAVYRFQEIPAHGHSEGRYDLEPSDAHGDTVATTRTYINGSGVAEAWFRFSGSTTEPYTSGYPARGASFIVRYGMVECYDLVYLSSDHIPDVNVRLNSLRARILVQGASGSENYVEISSYDAVSGMSSDSSTLSASSWGKLKEGK